MLNSLAPYPEYKDAREPWLGTIPAHWETRRNGRLFAHRVETGFPDLPVLEVSIKTGVRIRNLDSAARKQVMSDFGKYKRTCHGDIAYNMMRMWQGAVGVSPVDGLVSPAYVVARPHAGTNTRFYDYLFRTPVYMDEVNNFSRGIVSDRNRLYWDEFKQMPSPFPPPAEQAGIVRFLGAVDRKVNRFIRAKRRLIEVLTEQKQAIITHAVTKGLNPSAPTKPSGIDWLGDVPEHWHMKRLRHISPHISVGLVINPSTYFIDESTPGGIAMLLGNNITPGGFRLGNVRRISRASNDTLGASRLNAGDVVVVRVGAPGVAAVVPPELDQCNCASMMIVRRGRSFVSEWMVHAFNSSAIRSQVDVVKYGAAQKQFNISHAVNFWFPVPPKEEQASIVEHLRAALAVPDKAIDNASREIDLIREYRTRLVADVVTGRVDVRDVPLPPDDADDLSTIDQPAADDDDADSEADCDSTAEEAKA